MFTTSWIVIILLASIGLMSVQLGAWPLIEYGGGQGHQTLILNAADLSPTTSFFTNRGVGDNAAGGDTQVLFLGENTLCAGCHCWGSVGPCELGSDNNDRADGMQTYDEYRQWVVDFRDVNPFGQQRVRGGYGIDLATGELSEQSFNLSGQGGAWALIEDSDGRLWMGGQFATGKGESAKVSPDSHPQVTMN